MNRSATLAINFTLLSFTAFASGEKSERVNIFSAGYGAGVFSSNLRFNLYTSANYNFTTTGPIYLKYENRFTPNTSLGISASWVEAKYSFDYEDPYLGSQHFGEIHRSFSLLLRVNYYVWKSEKFEVYTGAGLGYVNHKGWYRNEVEDVFIIESVSPGFPFSFEATLGERYFISKGFGIYVEVGVAKSVLQGGVVWRI